MGTNYYLRKICEHCGRYDELHIGKSSAGWKFLFQKSPLINSIADAVFITCFGNIYDEYGSQITAKEFWDMVLEKQEEKPNTDEYCETIDGFDFCREDFD